MKRELLRRRNTRYKSPKLVSKHCRFRCKFWVDALRFSPCVVDLSRSKHLSRVEEMQCSDWLICLAWAQYKLWVWWKTSNKAKIRCLSRPALYFSQQLSSTCNKHFCCATSWSHKLKAQNIDPKVAMKQCRMTHWGFLYLIFCPLYSCVDRWPIVCYRCSSF